MIAITVYTRIETIAHLFMYVKMYTYVLHMSLCIKQ